MEHWTDRMKRNALSPEKAMELLAGWQRNETAIGMFFTAGAKSTVAMRTQVQRVSARRLELFDPEYPAGANFGLAEAGFSYGPVLMFPRWPLPPPVSVQGLSAWWPEGRWLFLWDARPGSSGANLMGPGMLGPAKPSRN